jgi:hypothetical protein
LLLQYGLQRRAFDTSNILDPVLISFRCSTKRTGWLPTDRQNETDPHSKIAGGRVVAKERGEATSGPPNLTVEKTVKSLKTSENSTTFENMLNNVRRERRTGRPGEEERSGDEKRQK